ncbi:MAG: hypothetical protein K6E64_06290 [Lachnospiraceae bacterium]|nr:hypothetical protein [Lachnospiraceae bacterium]
MSSNKHKENIIRAIRKVSVISAIPALVIVTIAILLLPIVIVTFEWSLFHMLSILYIIYGIAVVVVNRKGILNVLKRIGHAIPLIDRMMNEKNFRFRIFMYWGTFISFLMLVFYIIACYVYDSFWFGALAGYNLIIMIIRVVMSRQDFYYKRKGYTGEKLHIKQLKTFRWVGVSILLLNIVIGGMALLMTFENQYFPYNAALIMSIAIFAIYRFVTGISNAKKFSENKNKIFSASKILDMIIGIMAMYTLQTTMLSLLPDNNKGRFYANLVVGIIVFFISLVIGIHMVYTSTKEIYNIEKEKIDKSA